MYMLTTFTLTCSVICDIFHRLDGEDEDGLLVLHVIVFCDLFSLIVGRCFFFG